MKRYTSGGWFQILVLFSVVLYLMIHMIYRQTVENRGTLIFDDDGFVFMTRNTQLVDKYKNNGYTVMPFHSNEFNSLELFDEDLNPLVQLIIDGYDQLNDRVIKDMNDHIPEMMTTDNGKFFIKDAYDDNITVEYNWIHLSNGSKYLMLMTVSQHKLIWVSIDALLHYITYLLVMGMIIHSIWKNGRLNIAKYKTMLEEQQNMLDDSY